MPWMSQSAWPAWLENDARPAAWRSPAEGASADHVHSDTDVQRFDRCRMHNTEPMLRCEEYDRLLGSLRAMCDLNLGLRPKPLHFWKRSWQRETKGKGTHPVRKTGRGEEPSVSFSSAQLGSARAGARSLDSSFELRNGSGHSGMGTWREPYRSP